MRFLGINFGGTRAALEAELERERSRVSEVEGKLKSEIARLEGLLDVAADPDAGLPGYSKQGLYREISGGRETRSRDLSEEHRKRILSLAHLTYALRGDAEDLLETHLDFMLGDRLVPKSKDERLEKALLDVWEDDRNRLYLEHEPLTLALLLEGELALSASLSPVDGHLEIGWLDPLRVKEVVQDSFGRDLFLLVEGPSPGTTLRYFILQNLRDGIEVEIEAGSPPNAPALPVRYVVRSTSVDATGAGLDSQSVTVDGLAFYQAWNRPAGATRGRSELSSVLDLIDAHDEMLWASVDVQNLRRLFVFHLKDPGIKTPAQAAEKLRELKLATPPKNPRVLATDDRTSVEFQSPSSPTAADSWLAEELGVAIYGAKGFPGFWRGSSSESNLASARAMDAKPLRRLRRKQRRVRDFWHRVLEVSVDLRRRAGAAIPEAPFEVVAFEVGGPDKQRAAEILKAISSAAQLMAAAGAAKPELLQSLFVQAAEDGGFSIDRKDLGLPPDLAEQVGDLGNRVAALVNERGRTNAGNQDEGDRDRGRERVA
jgi:hypothetical protein